MFNRSNGSLLKESAAALAQVESKLEAARADRVLKIDRLDSIATISDPWTFVAITAYVSAREMASAIRLLSDGRAVFSVAAVLRASLECTFWALWLLEEPELLHERWLFTVGSDLIRGQQFLEQAGWTHSEVDDALQPIEDLEGLPGTDATSLFRKYAHDELWGENREFKGENLYRYLSGLTHGNAWALLLDTEESPPQEVHSLAISVSDAAVTAAIKIGIKRLNEVAGLQAKLG